MKYFLVAKHWQIFLLIVGLPIVGDLLLSQISAEVFSIYSILTIISGISFFIWLWSIESLVSRAINNDSKTRTKQFRIIFLAVIIYFTISLVLIYSDMYFDSIFWFILHIICIILVLNIFYQCAKLIKHFELHRDPKFGEVFFYFILVWFFPIGIWILQPKLNKIIYHSLKNY